MSEEDGDEIEFLDEDADVVQQYVQSLPVPIKIEEEEPPPHVIPKPDPLISSLLVERPTPSSARSASSSARKKRKKDEDDSDYDPSEDIPQRRRRRPPPPLPAPAPSPAPPPRARRYDPSGQSQAVQKVVHKPAVKKPEPAVEAAAANRRELTIRIPDFDDPLCLPVRAVAKDEGDARRLRHWNALCLDQFKTYDTPLRPRSGIAVSSKRTVVIRNLFNKNTGKTETSFWSKITVQSKNGDVKSDGVQSVLPRYREKKILNTYQLADVKQRRPIHSRSEVILMKEKDGQEETLVAYKPDESLAMVFKMIEKKGEQGSAGAGEEEQKRCLEERVSCRMCAPCYQTSWRGVENNIKHMMSCPVCERASVSVHSLVAHVRTHAPALLRPHRRALSAALAEMLVYHYRCRVCQRHFPRIGALRRHLSTHKGLGKFYCEVGGHTVS